MNQRTIVPCTWLCPNHVRYIPRPIVFAICTRNIGPIGSLSSARLSIWIESFPNRSALPYVIQCSPSPPNPSPSARLWMGGIEGCREWDEGEGGGKEEGERLKYGENRSSPTPTPPFISGEGGGGAGGAAENLEGRGREGRGGGW